MGKKLTVTKQHLIKLLQTPMDEDYTFVVAAKTEQDAKRFVQRMRTELSRLRDEAVREGHRIKSFKVLQMQIMRVDDFHHEIKLRRSAGVVGEINQEMRAVMSEIIDDGPSIIKSENGK